MRSRHLGRRRGAAAVEFVMLTPLLLTLVAGAMTFGLAGYAKFRLSDALMVASRNCVAVGSGTCAANAQNIAANRWPAAASVCDGGLRTSVLDQNGVITVSGTCAFTGGVMQGFMGLSNMSIASSAAMPY